jgi:uncharacterized phage infection (PIP) family protein YhgE
MEDKLARFQLQSQQQHHQDDGRRKRRFAMIQAQAALLHRDHELQMTELLSKAKEMDDAMRQDFETQVEQCDRYIQKKAEEKLAPIEATITRTQAMIVQYRDAPPATEPEDEPTSQAHNEALQRLERDKLKSLAQQLKQRNAERLNALIAGRERLSECVETLEHLESSHSTTISTLTSRLESIDTRYQEKLRTLTDNHNQKTDSTRRKVKEAEMKMNHVQHAFHETEKRCRSEMNECNTENELLRTELMRLRDAIEDTPNLAGQLAEAATRLSQKKMELQQRDELVLQLRAESQSLSREVARLNHEAAIEKRRAALGVF